MRYKKSDNCTIANICRFQFCERGNYNLISGFGVISVPSEMENSAFSENSYMILLWEFFKVFIFQLLFWFLHWKLHLYILENFIYLRFMLHFKAMWTQLTTVTVWIYVFKFNRIFYNITTAKFILFKNMFWCSICMQSSFKALKLKTLSFTGR